MPVVNGPQIISSNGMTRFIFSGPGPPSYPKENKDAHATSYGVVYANDAAREDLTAKSPQPYRPGAIIVREKLSKPDSQTPELLAVMIKREKGFNPPANDWEFLTTNGAATKIKHREKVGACLECHASQRARDFVYKDYKPQ